MNSGLMRRYPSSLRSVATLSLVVSACSGSSPGGAGGGGAGAAGAAGGPTNAGTSAGGVGGFAGTVSGGGGLGGRPFLSSGGTSGSAAEAGSTDEEADGGVGGAGDAPDGVAGESNGGSAADSSGGAPLGGAGDGLAGNGGAAGAGVAGAGTVETLAIAKVWSGHPVGFYLLTHNDKQFAAFYDENRALTVAERSLGSSSWRLQRLQTSVGWDSHNDIVMAVDDDGFIHLAGNMHSSPLVYFRTTSPADVTTFQRVNSMVGMNETSCTYPQFFAAPNGELVFMYRDGTSGNGNHIFNAYSTATKSWRRLLGSALTDGQGQRNAYPVGPVQGPDRLWHLVWVWRDTPDASTNHDLSYARTADLLSWQTAAGKSVGLPMRLSGELTVDAVPVNGGMINNNTKVGFDAQMRPVVAYHKYDTGGKTQLYNARFEDGAWVSHKTSDWGYRWEFGGGGTLVFEIEVEPVVLQPDGTLTQNWYHARYGGRGAFRLNPTTLAAEATIPQPVPYAADLARVESRTEGMEVRWRKDAAATTQDGVVYMLRWETLPSNRDMPREPIPGPTELRLYGFRAP